jgi:sterol desaturase/sphingolipid hydroxylase (fatty acid hydroxylase superfamily)
MSMAGLHMTQNFPPADQSSQAANPGKPTVSGGMDLRDLWLAMDHLPDTLLAWKAAAVLLWFALLFAGERLAPAAPWPRDRDGTRFGAGVQRVARNLTLWLVNVGLSPLIVLPLSFWASEAAPDWRPAAWSGWPGLLADLVVLDFLIYWWHLANHRLPVLWRFHEVHHLDQFLDTTTAVRFHFGEVLISALVRAAAIYLLAFPFSSILAFETLVLAATLFHHSNLRLPVWLERALSRLIITPSIHWVHHHARRSDTDSNYGTIFSFWDRLFFSRSPTKRTLDMAIGVQGRREQPLPRLVLRPFLPAAARDAPEP